MACDRLSQNIKQKAIAYHHSYNAILKYIQTLIAHFPYQAKYQAEGDRTNAVKR